MDLIILHDRLSQSNQSIIKSIYPNSNFIQVNNDNYSYIDTKSIPNSYLISTYYKLDVFLLKSYKKVLMIDLDMICINKFDDDFFNNDAHISIVEQDINTNNYNTGFMLLKNTVLTDNIYNRLLNYVGRNIMYPDQEIINDFFKHTITKLPVKYNLHYSKQLQNDTTMIHYYGVRKPWHQNDNKSATELLWHKFNNEAKEYYGLK